VAQPDVADGLLDVQAVAAGTHSVWAWSIPAASWSQSNSWEIGTDNHSAVAHLYVTAKSIADAGQAVYGSAGLPLVIWAKPGTTWDCGACFWTGIAPVVGGVSFASNIWMGWGDSESVWSDAVMAHEMGHWWMESYGKPPGEGGLHYLGITTYPGQAWSEGWATWLSAASRGSSVYYDKQGTTFFWFDLASQLYNGSKAFALPLKQAGLLQLMDENVVAAMLWGLAPTPTASPSLLAPALAGVWQALASPRMTLPPYARNYTVHIWDVAGPGVFENVVDTNVPAPMVADFLDALLCVGGFAANAVDAVIGDYPYNAAAPKCGSGGTP
jgi:hypothetical protein